MKRYFLDTPEGQIHYRLAGKGEPSIILLHQTPRSSDEFLEVMPLLAQKRRVIAMDTPGCGDSDKNTKWLTIEDYARIVIMLMDSLDIEKAVVAGHHTGTKTAIELATSFPNRVDRIVLLGPYFWKDESRQKGISGSGRWAEVNVTQDGSYLIDIWNAAKRTLEHRLDIAHRRVLDHLKCGIDSAHRGHYASASYRQEDRLSLIKCPTLCIWGTKDLVWHDELGFHRRGFAEAIPHCEVVEIPGGGRELACEMPEQFARAVLEFIDKG